MKYYIPQLLFIVFICLSCDEVKKLADVEFETNLTITLPVTVTSTDEQTFDIVLDATTDADIKDYASAINNYEIQEFLIAIENYTSATTAEIYFNGELGFSKKSENQPSSTCSISNLNITHIAGTGSFPINNCDAILSEIGAILLSDNAVKLYMIGTFTKEPLAFDLKATVKVKVTANPI